MTRKLQHSVTALSASAAVFGLLLFAGGPPQPTTPQASDIVLVSADGADVPPDEAGNDGIEDGAAGNRHHRRARAALALPYFSFAQGLRRVTGS
jgi:hypothetical protein